MKSAWLQDYERRLALPWWHVDHPRFALRFAYFSVALSAVALALNVGLLLRVW